MASRPPTNPPEREARARMFAPTVQFYEITMPIEDLAYSVQEYLFLENKLPLGADCVTWNDEGAHSVVFRMSADAFLSYGAFVLQSLHLLCRYATVEAGNYFLNNFYAEKGMAGDLPPPAEEMRAVLYYSDDNGANWHDGFQLSPPEGPQN